MTFIRGSVGILAWGVLVCAALAAGVTLLNGDVFTAAVSGLVAWGAWLVLQRMVEAG